jgi:hypothetical protein
MSSGSSLENMIRPRLRTFSSLTKEAGEEETLAFSKSLSEFYSEITKLPSIELDAYFELEEIRGRLMTA